MDNLDSLIVVLRGTLSSNINERKESEKYLKSAELSKNYGIMLLNLTGTDNQDLSIRICAAVTFKNYVKKYWKVVNDDPDCIIAEDRDKIKASILSFMTSLPFELQKQISEAISIIGREDFPDKWSNLLPNVIKELKTGNLRIINAVLQTTDSIFERYQHEFKSNELWSEIKYVLDTFASPLTELFKSMMQLLQNTSNFTLEDIFQALIYINKIFYSLNSQDLPEFFEDNMRLWMENFHILLSVSPSILINNQKTNQNEEGLVEVLKCQICNNVAMYAQKYDEEFAKFLPKFVEAIWSLVTQLSSEVKYDNLVTSAIEFLATVAQNTSNKQMFNNEQAFSHICNKIILPNMELRNSDIEMFEDNPEEFINIDIEESNVGTRRKATSDLIKALNSQFEEVLTKNFSQFVIILLQKYQASPSTEWKSKDLSIYLLTCLAVKGKTEAQGVTASNNLVNITDFYNSHILPELQEPSKTSHAIIKADSLKFLSVFRNQLPEDILRFSFTLIIPFLSFSSSVIHSYAAHALEHLLITFKTPMFSNTGDNNSLPKECPLNKLVITSEVIKSVAPLLFESSFKTLESSDSKENVYVIKAIMRSLHILGKEIVPQLALSVLAKLSAKLSDVSKNPGKPFFNHYLFESLCLNIRFTCSAYSNLTKDFEQHLLPVIQYILQQDITDFIPYTFQLLSVLIISINEVPSNSPYNNLYPFLLTPALWEHSYNIPALIQLLDAYILKCPLLILEKREKVSQLFEIIQKLISSKSHDHEALYILQKLFYYLPDTFVNAYTKQVFVMLFQRLTTNRTPKYSKALILFFCSFVCKFGASNFIKLVNDIQPKIFGMVVERLFLQDASKITKVSNKRVVIVGLIKFLTDAEQYTVLGDYAHFWPKLFELVLQILSSSGDEVSKAEEDPLSYTSVCKGEVRLSNTEKNHNEYQTQYSQLSFSIFKHCNEFVDSITDMKAFFNKNLSILSSSSTTSSKVNSFLVSLPYASAKTLQELLSSTNVKLN